MLTQRLAYDIGRSRVIRLRSSVDGLPQLGIEPDREGIGRTRTHGGTARRVATAGDQLPVIRNGG